MRARARCGVWGDDTVTTFPHNCHATGCTVAVPRRMFMAEELDGAWRARARELSRLRDKEAAKKQHLYEWIASARERIEQERDATRLTFDDPKLTTHQQDMASARAWAFDLALHIIADAKDAHPESGDSGETGPGAR